MTFLMSAYNVKHPGFGHGPTEQSRVNIFFIKISAQNPCKSIFHIHLFAPLFSISTNLSSSTSRNLARYNHQFLQMNNCKELFSSPQVLRTQIYEAIMQRLNLWDNVCRCRPHKVSQMRSSRVNSKNMNQIVLYSG